MQFLKDLWSARELLVNLVMREVRGQYKRTVMGRLWSLLNPIASMLVYTLIFSLVLRIKPAVGDPSGLDVFALWLLCGLLPWTFFANSLNIGMQSLVVNAPLVTKVYFPRAVLPISTVGTMASNWIVEMGVLIAALTIAGSVAILWMPAALLFMLLMALFTVGITIALAVANAWFRDIQHLVSLLLQFWMYFTPIIYPVSMVQNLSEKVGGLLGTSIQIIDIYTLNPLYSFVTAFRQLLYDNRWPDASVTLGCLVWTVISLLIGIIVFSRNEKKIAEIV